MSRFLWFTVYKQMKCFTKLKYDTLTTVSINTANSKIVWNSLYQQVVVSATLNGLCIEYRGIRCNGGSFYRAATNADVVWRWKFCLSVRLSVCQRRALWQNGTKIWKEEWLVWATPSTWNFGSTGPRLSVAFSSPNLIVLQADYITMVEGSL